MRLTDLVTSIHLETIRWRFYKHDVLPNPANRV
jgi:hypothetical protein